MGNDASHHPTFVRQQWQIVEKNPKITLWRSRNEKNLQIEQYDIFTRDDQELKQSREVFDFRYRHPQLVSSLYYQEQKEQEFCAISHQYGLFIEKIPIRLIDIEHIPYPDFLHLYSQALNGFYLIAKRYGCFEVEEEYIGVNERGVVKVWMNRDYSRSFIAGGRISQEHMVKGIVDIIDANCDLHRLEGRPTVRNYLYRNADMLRFQEALRQLQSYIRQYNQGYVPEKLDCIDRVGGIYVIVNRESVSEESESARTNNYFIRNPGEHNRPKLASQLQISESKIAGLPPPQQQVRMVHQPAVNHSLKGSEAFPHPRREQYIIPPEAAREDMEVVRRRRSQYQTQHPIVDRRELRPMKYSQNIGQPSSHYISPIKGPGAITFTLSPTKNTQVQQVRPVETVNRNSSYADVPPQIRQSSESNSHTVTFKMLNQNSSEPYHHNFDINLHNTSIANMSSNTSRSNTNRIHHYRPSGERDSTFVQPIYQERDQGSKPTFRHNRSQSEGLQFQNETFRKKVDVRPEYRAEQASYQQPTAVQQESRVEPSYESRYQLGDQPTRPNISEGALYGNSYRERNEHSLTSFQEQQPPINTRMISLEERVDRLNKQESRASKYEDYSSSIYNNPTVKQSPGHSYTQSLQSSEKSNKYKSVSVDDGKSSEEFLRQLKEIRSSMHQNNYESNKNSAFTPTYTTETHDQYKSNNFYQPSQSNKYDPLLNHQLSPFNTDAHFDPQDFGRNTVSNIIQTQDSPQANKNYMLVRSNTPLMFEKNLEMKYSMLGDDPESPSQSPFRDYDNRIDSDILADLRKMQS